METKKVEKYHPKPIEKIYCRNKGCGELLLKVYPYALVTNPNGQTQIYCMKCQHKGMKK